MPRNITITFTDGSAHRYENIPDNVTPDMIEARCQKDFPDKRITNIDGGKKSSQPAEINQIKKNAGLTTKEEPIPIAEPNVKMYLLNLKVATNGNLIVKTKRVGPSGTSTTIREIDCVNQLWKYLEDNGTPVKEPKMSKLVPGSTAWHIFQYCCKKANS